jgi:ectoine hydroxylase-related dioxygenase (phytanoyl-CoA dioxygenase family)
MNPLPASLSSALSRPYPLPREAVEHYRECAWIKLRDVLEAEVIAHFDRIITDAVVRLNTQHLPMAERDTYGKAFLQVTNLWTREEAVRPLVFSPRLAGIAAQLMEVDGVRLYHDQALYKEAGGGYTPWHADQYYWPLATEKSITAWIPLQETPLEMGALEYSAGSHTLTIGRDKAISDESEKLIDDALKASDCPHVVEPFSLGEVGFHAGWLFHRAAPNTTDRPRRVMCVIYMDREMRLKAPENDHQSIDGEVWCPGVEAGQIIDSPLNPVIPSAT